MTNGVLDHVPRGTILPTLTLLSAIALASSAVPFTAVAQSCDVPLWTAFQMPPAMLPVTVQANDRNFGLGLTTDFHGNKMSLRWNEVGEAACLPAAVVPGQLFFEWEAAGDIVGVTPFAIDHNGFPRLYVIDASATITPWRCALQDGPGRTIRRLSCASDQLGPAAVQHYWRSNAAFQAAVATDLVIVPTRHGCGDFATDRVYGLSGSDLQTRWIFNQFQQFSMDAATEAPTIDYRRNHVYVGTELDPGRSQPTVWCLDSRDGSFVWAKNLGSVVCRPRLGPNGKRLYVAAGAFLYALEP
jgi:hypothetical protein